MKNKRMCYAEICFYDSYSSEYNKWHRMFYGEHKSEKRIEYDELLTILASQDIYRYIGYVVDK
mgnify:CR=1 FL=1